MTRRGLLGILICAGLLSSCAKDDTPAEPVWGKQACAHCAMILSDRRFGGQLVANGDRLFFDDLGCLVAFAGEHEIALEGGWTRDADSGVWLRLERARYTDGAPSPMDFGFEAHEATGIAWGVAHARLLEIARTRR